MFLFTFFVASKITKTNVKLKIKFQISLKDYIRFLFLISTKYCVIYFNESQITINICRLHYTGKIELPL